ncbi:thiamine phosphate synthase [Frateuria sp. STR12]|uniref:thiamine phosphate synthase n=1 Tax=Frateuria hangzhouensis TaxID=2995589 RepID=UPI002260F996|nr:thiamine phosphate synthase [Frateuria sp. STR12]MCX7514426.1 thiamine phosphate synthase [Frateuria sp. STR12]
MPDFPSRGLYAITDGPRPDLLHVAQQALAGGARLLQYRDLSADQPRRLAEAQALKRVCDERGVPLLVNGDAALAQAVGAAGVHLGETTEDVASARERLGPRALVGVSCFGSLERARAMVAAGASYVSFGAFFPSPTLPHAKLVLPDVMRQSAALGVPRVAIGGITPENGAILVDAGADYLAAISAVFGHADVRAAAQRMAGLYRPPSSESPR